MENNIFVILNYLYGYVICVNTFIFKIISKVTIFSLDVNDFVKIYDYF